MPRASYTTSVQASIGTVWDLLLDKIENPGKYLPGVEKSKIIERSDEGVLRYMKTKAFEIREWITIDSKDFEITFLLVDHPKYSGKVVNKVAPFPNAGNNVVNLTFAIDWTPKTKEAEDDDMEPIVKQAVLHTKEIAEKAEKPI